MARPLVGIIGNPFLLENGYPVQGVGISNISAISDVANCMPLMIPTDPDYLSVDELLEAFDGFIFTGGGPNVHPENYGHEETEAHGTFNRGRDAITLPLVRALVDRGQPFLAICRGFQEVNVAMGGTLHPEIRDLEGRDNHRMPPDGTLEEKFALRHCVHLNEDGPFARLFGKPDVMTNTLHGQGICQPGPRVIIDGRAPDGTPEAIFIKDAEGFALSVQWHPEWNAANDPVSFALFSAFGNAARDWSRDLKKPALKSA